MCQPGKLASAAFTLNPAESFSKVGQAFSPKAPKFPALKKPPKVIDPTKDIALAEQHQKEARIGAYSYSDTVLAGSIGSAPTTNLWKLLGTKG